MEESKRWIVTYTKHLRQKRKVYQDGIIEFHSPSNKVLLYDADQKLLATRILKKDEVIESGATLAFETLLVDVGELDATFKALQDMNASISRGKSRGKVERVQKSDGAFLVKKRHQDVGRLPNVCDNPVKVTEREWDVLYTSQVTQKAKRYHDGILKLVTSGSYMAQLILLKEDGSTLTSKFHKSSECLIIGNSYELPNYLVEICGQRNVPEEENNCGPQRRIQNENPPIWLDSRLKVWSNKIKGNRNEALLAVKSFSSKFNSPKLESGTSEWNGNLSSSLKTSLADVAAYLFFRGCVHESKLVQASTQDSLLGVLYCLGWVYATHLIPTAVIHCHEGSDDKILRRQVSSEAAMFTKVEVPVNKPRDAVQILSVLRRPHEETILRDCSSPSMNLIISSPRHSNVLHPECEEEIPQGSSSAFLAAMCEEDSCKIAVPDHEIKCVVQDTLNLEVSQEGPATLIPENISGGILTAKESLGSQAKGILVLESGLLNEESGLHVDILGVPKQLKDSDKISSEENKEREGETTSSFPSFDLGF